MLLPVLIVIKQHSLISPETKVCLLGSPCTCESCLMEKTLSQLAIMFSRSGSVIVTAWDLRHEPAGWKIWSQFAFTVLTARNLVS